MVDDGGHHKEGDVKDAAPIQHVEETALTTHPAADDEPTGKLSIKTWIALFALGFLYSAALGAFIVIANIINVINADIGPDPNYAWIASAWTIAVGVGYVLMGTISDLFGRRWFIFSSGILGTFGCLVGALARNVGTVIAAMALIGFGEAGASLCLPAVSELVAKKWRGPSLAVINGACTFWIICGSLIGHAICVNTAPGWRTVFWLFMGIHALASVLIFLFYYPATPLAALTTSKAEILRSFDWVGAVLVAAGPTLMLMGIIWVTSYGPQSPQFLAPFLVGSILLVVLGFHEVYWAKNPLLHPALFKRMRTFTGLLLVALVGGMLFYSIEDFLPTYLELLYDGNDAIAIGVDSMPFGAGSNFGGVGSAILLPIIGKRVGTNWMLVVGVILQIVFIPLMCVPDLTNKGMALAFSFMGGVGIGIVELLTILLVQYSTPDEYIGFASGALGLFRSIGGAAGTAIYTTVFTNKATELVPINVATAAVTAGLPESSLPQLLGILSGAVQAPLSSVPGVTPTILEVSVIALKEAYRSSFRYVWLTSIGFGIISLACALYTKDLSEHLTNKVVQHIKSEETHSTDLEKAKAGDVVTDKQNQSLDVPLEGKSSTVVAH